MNQVYRHAMRGSVCCVRAIFLFSIVLFGQICASEELSADVDRYELIGNTLLSQAQIQSAINGATGLGYWIPQDASANDPKGWISNADLNRLLTRSKSKQMVVVSDSCYSGLFAQESKVNSANTTGTIDELLQHRAVTVMTSGGDEPVADRGKDSHSVFAWNLVNNLKNVTGWKRGASLFDSVRVAVEKELPQTPHYGASLSAGHQAGGDYVFERRASSGTLRP